ncbi:MAG TPA: hypothetical protein VFI95_21165 [Terriglobales bacterium]|nr:hypothetical protein [Terriglobales bacterium]
MSRIISILMLLISAVALLLAVRKPQAPAPPQSRAALVANAQSFQSKLDQMQQAQARGENGSEAHFTADEIEAAIAQASGPVPEIETATPQAGPTPVANANTPPDSNSSNPNASLDKGSAEASLAGAPLVSFQGDTVTGQFVTQMGGRNVYVTVSGHLGAKDGYATFEPTEFKIGDLNVPVALVNEALQKKMLEQRDRLKLPDFVSDVRVENGELVIKQK